MAKISYHKATFILSVIGFIGSIGFYLGVLRQVYSTEDQTHLQDKVEQLEVENRKLRETISQLNPIQK